jgi:hypothetical protein
MQIFDVNGKPHYYKSIWFSPEAVSKLYLGSAFIGFDPQDNQNFGDGHPREHPSFQRALEAGMYGFMPDVVESLNGLFGEGNYVYDGWEIGPGDALLYYLLPVDEYPALIEKLGFWVKAQELDGLVEF